MLNWIVGATAASRRRPWMVIAIALVLAGLGFSYSARHLQVDTDTNRLFSSKLAWRQAQIAELKNFPQFDSLIVAVVRGTTPEEAVETARALTIAARQDKAHFISADYPADADFYKHNGLLLLPIPELAKLLNGIVAAQPFLGQLAADPSARGLFTGMSLIAQGVAMGQADLRPFAPALKRVRAVLQAAASGHAPPLSWQSMIAGETADDAVFVLLHPVLHGRGLQPGGGATAALVALGKSLPDVKAGRATVDYTGQIPLSDEQFASLTHGLVIGGVLSVILIALWLYLALRSWRLILPIIATLLLGLTLTITFAAIAIGVLNLISVAFAILFIGLAVDFAIQFCVRLRDVRHDGLDLHEAIPETARQAGGQIALAAASTACGFLAFSPTPFVGVAELGVIAGAGMIIAFLCTITFLPALLAVLRPRPETVTVGLPFGPQADEILIRYRGWVMILFGIVAIISVVGAATLHFDANPLDTKDPNTESMRTLSRLLNNPATNPFYAEALAPDLAAARVLAARLAKLPQVSGVVSGATFIPDDQGQKLAMIGQAKDILAPTLLASQGPTTAPTAQDLKLSIRLALNAIDKARPQIPAGSPMLGIAAAMQTLVGEDDAHLLATNEAISRFLPAELKQLNDSLSPMAVTAENLPADIKRDWFLPDGRVRVEALPTPAAQRTRGLRDFAHAVLSVAPNAGGPAISTIATSGTILASFREAAILATIAIAAILLIVFRNLADTALVLVTLALSALLTALFAKLWGLSINYANIIALPLLLGVGVSFNVYFVMNYRAGMRRFLSSATAHAVLFSALTTATAFGTLAASHDRGTASMGVLLLLSLAAVLIATFFFLPALLYVLAARHAAKAQL